MYKRMILVGTLTSSSLALAQTSGQPSYDELRKRLDDLQAKIERLEARQRNYVPPADVDATVRRVMQDADRRSRLFSADATLTAGYRDGKLIIQTADGKYLFHPYTQMQFREIGNWRQGAGGGGGGDDWQNGFEMRRMKFGVDGNLFSRDFTYAFQWATDRNSGTPVLEDAWARYRFLQEWSLIAGQFKDPFAHEALVSSKYLMAPERSLIGDVFAGGDNYVQGVGLGWENQDNLRVSSAFHDGANVYPGVNGANNDFQDFPNPNGTRFAADFGGAARVEFKAFGDWKDYNDFSAVGVKRDLLVLGAAADVTEAGDTTVYSQTADAQYKVPGGWTLYGAGYVHEVQDSPVSPNAGATHDVLDWGALAQVTYLFAPKWEAYGRYNYINLDANSALIGKSRQQDVHEISVGVNYYIYGQSAKLTLDATYLPEGTPVGDTGSDVLANDGGSEFILAAQFQLLL